MSMNHDFSKVLNEKIAKKFGVEILGQPPRYFEDNEYVEAFLGDLSEVLKGTKPMCKSLVFQASTYTIDNLFSLHELLKEKS